MYYRMDGTPYEGPDALMQWAMDFKKTDKRRVAFDSLDNGLEVSTVWLGLDHNNWGTGRPKIFETMVFVPTKKSFTWNGRTIKFDREEFSYTRYSTLEEARLGHKMMVKRCKSLKSIEQILKTKGG